MSYWGSGGSLVPSLARQVEAAASGLMTAREAGLAAASGLMTAREAGLAAVSGLMTELDLMAVTQHQRGLVASVRSLSPSR